MAKISACLIVRNEENNLCRCLESLVGVVDEIIFIHDGTPDDNSCRIAEDYGARIFIRPYSGMMETHLVFAIRQSVNDWILRIDADEFLSQDLKDNLCRLLTEEAGENFDAFSFFWTDFSLKDNTFLKNKNRKTVLFKKEKLFWFTMPHYSLQTRGKIKNSNYILGHVLKDRKGKKWIEKQKEWAAVQASYILKDFVDLENFQATRKDWEKTYSLSRKYADNFLLPYFKYLYSFIKNLFIAKTSFRNSLLNSWYNFRLGRELNKRANIIKLSKDKQRN